MITGKTLAEDAQAFAPGRPHPVLRPPGANPVKERGGYAILSGSLAPGGRSPKLRTSHV